MRHRLLAGLLVATDIAHFVIPDTLARIVPPALGAPHLWIYGSGVAELAGAAAIAHPRTRRFGGYFCALLFVVVFPANVYMALEPDRVQAPPWIAWARLPLQPALIWWALSVARRSDVTALSERDSATKP